MSNNRPPAPHGIRTEDDVKEPSSYSLERRIANMVMQGLVPTKKRQAQQARVNGVIGGIEGGGAKADGDILRGA